MTPRSFLFLLLSFVKLLTSGNLLDQFLNNDTVVVIGFTRCHLQVVHGRKDYTAASCARTLVHSVFFLLTFYLVHSVRLVESLKNTLCQSAFASPRWSIEKKMREIITLR